MRRTGYLLAGTAALALALSPGLAHARTGNSTSMGSRGSQTYTPPPATRTAPTTAQPMQQTITPRTTAPTAAPMGGPAAGPSRGSSFMSGLMGGLIGAGIGGLLFGHGFFGAGMGGIGFLGLLLQIGLIAAVVWLVVRLFRGRPQPAMAGGPNIYARGPDAGRGPMTGSGGGLGGQARPPVAIGAADYQQFEQLLQGIQAAWSNQDINGLRAMVTPEMLSYLGEQLGEQTSRGVRNQVTDVRLLSGDLAEAWAEGDREYATVAMRFQMIDVTRDASGRIVEGNPSQPVAATEVWTFVRARGGHWLLSAIQQTN